jgi:signal transduction histidine kinase
MFLTQVLEELEPQRQQKPELSFAWRVAPGLPTLFTDRAKLKIILKNLLGNAFKFTDAGGVTLEASPQESGVEFRVSDTGIGMASQLLPEIFDMFRQGDSSMTRRHEGIGLGLYIVRQLVDLLGGTVTVDSEVGRGSIFHVWIPNGAPPVAVDRELHLE